MEYQCERDLRNKAGNRSGGYQNGGQRRSVVVQLSPSTRTAARFTQNAFRAAPVDMAASHLAATRGRPRCLLINTGNANAGTGEAGHRAAMACCDAIATELGISRSEVMPFSTGVIGEPLPADRIISAK